jgi:hypothetical protein
MGITTFQEKRKWNGMEWIFLDPVAANFVKFLMSLGENDVL